MRVQEYRVVDETDKAIKIALVVRDRLHGGLWSQTHWFPKSAARIDSRGNLEIDQWILNSKRIQPA
jgi:hypothetical protein